MKNAMSLKAIVKNLAKEKNISAQLVLQNYMMERFLIASMVGLDSRATMDIDATIKNYPVSEETVKQMIVAICEIKIDDDISFEFKSIGEIREGDDYTGYRVAVIANYPPMAVPLKLDITTGDKITPREIEYKYKLMMEDRTINVLAYNLATILAEKLETVISRGEQNTRPRDYYDIYILTKLRQDDIEFDLLREALNATTEKRGSSAIISRYQGIIDTVKNSEVMNRQWENYRKDFDYAAEVDFVEVCNVVTDIFLSMKKFQVSVLTVCCLL